MNHDELVTAFAQTVGVEKAQTVVTSAAKSLNLDADAMYSTEEVIDVCEVIQHNESGYLAMIANEIRVDQQAERRFETLLANVPEPAVVAAFEGEKPVVSMVNDAFEETFGYEPGSIVGSRLETLIVPPEAPLSAAALWARTDDGSGTEVERVTADGRRRTFLFRSAIVTRETGETEGYGIYTDISVRKRREQTLKHQNEQLERFVEVISHDLRNPLEVSTGRIELARSETANDEVRKTLEAALSANERMNTLIEDLLTLAKQGRVVGETERVSLAVAARSAWSHVETGSATLQVRDDTSITANPGRLSSLFENLFRNAVEHGSRNARSQTEADSDRERPSGTPTHTEATVNRSPSDPETNDDAVTVTVGATEQGFYVADDGPGIDPEHRASVFEDGFTTSKEGTGLGLSIVDAVAEAHGWSISVGESEAGGARFDVTI